MSRSNIFFSLVFLCLAFLMVPFGFAQDGTWSNNAVRSPLYPGEQIRFTGAIDSLGTLYSKAFNLRKYDNVYWGTPADTSTRHNIRSMFDTNNVVIDTTFLAYDRSLYRSERYPFRVRYQATSTQATPKLSAYVQANFVDDSTDANWTNIDTIFTDLTAETVADIDVDLNNKKYPWYRLKIVGVALGQDDQVIDIKFFCYQEMYGLLLQPAGLMLTAAGHVPVDSDSFLMSDMSSPVWQRDRRKVFQFGISC